MSKRKGTTKVATLISWVADCGHEGKFDCGGSLSDAHSLGDGYVLGMTTCGMAQWFSGFNYAIPGDKVVLRKRGGVWWIEGFAS